MDRFVSLTIYSVNWNWKGSNLVAQQCQQSKGSIHNEVEAVRSPACHFQSIFPMSPWLFILTLAALVSIGQCFQFPFKTTCQWHRKSHGGVCSNKVVTNLHRFKINSIIPNTYLMVSILGGNDNLKEVDVFCGGKQDRFERNVLSLPPHSYHFMWEP